MEMWSTSNDSDGEDERAYGFRRDFLTEVDTSYELSYFRKTCNKFNSLYL